MKKILSLILCVLLLFSCLFSADHSGKTAYAAGVASGETYNATVKNEREYVMEEDSLLIPIYMERDGLAEVEITVSGNKEKVHGAAMKKALSNVNLGNADTDFYWHTWFDGKRNWSFGANRETIAYLLITKDEKDYGTPITIKLKSEYFPADYGREIKPGVKVNFNQVNTDEYWRITLKKNSIINIKGKDVYVNLCNAKKKQIASSCNQTDICLQKGSYYINTQKQGRHMISYTARTVSGTNGNNTAKGRAQKISLGKKTVGIYACSPKVKSYYYKFSVNKKRNMTLKYKYTVANLCDWELYNKSGKKICFLDTYNEKGIVSENGKTYKKITLKKGTYYLKSIRKQEYGGMYTIYVK